MNSSERALPSIRSFTTVDQVVHDYGDLCESVTELAAEKKAPVTVDEFRTFNRCLDNAIAYAVSAFGEARDKTISAAGAQEMNERLGSLAHELRNQLNAAKLLAAIRDCLAASSAKAPRVPIEGWSRSYPAAQPRTNARSGSISSGLRNTG